VGDCSLHRGVDGERLLSGRADWYQRSSSDENPTKYAFHCFTDAEDAMLVTTVGNGGAAGIPGLPHWGYGFTAISVAALPRFRQTAATMSPIAAAVHLWGRQ